MIVECYGRSINSNDFILFKRSLNGVDLYCLLKNIDGNIYTDGNEIINIDSLSKIDVLNYVYKYENIKEPLLDKFNSKQLSMSHLLELNSRNSAISNSFVYLDSFGQQLCVGDVVISGWNKRGSKLGIVIGNGEVVDYLGKIRHPTRVIKVNSLLGVEQESMSQGFNYYISFYSNLGDNATLLNGEHKHGDSFLLNGSLVIFLSNFFIELEYKHNVYTIKKLSPYIIRMNLNCIGKLEFVNKIKNQNVNKADMNLELQSFLYGTYNKYRFSKCCHYIEDSWQYKDSYVHTSQFAKELLQSYSKYFKTSGSLLNALEKCYYLGNISLDNIIQRITDDVTIKILFD